MKKSNSLKYRKIVSMLLIGFMIFLISGCGKEERDVKELVYKGEVLPCMEQIKGEIAAYTVCEDNIYIYTTEWVETEYSSDSEDSPETEALTEDIMPVSRRNQYFYKCRADGSDFTEIPVALPHNSDEWLNYFRVSEEGRFSLLYSSYNIATGNNTYLLRTMAEDGSIIQEKDITDIFEREEEEDIIFHGMELDKDGNIYLLTDKSVFLFDKEGDMLAEMEEGNSLTNMAVTNKGQVIIYVSSEEEFYVKTIDPQKLEFGRKVEIALNSYNYTSLISGGEYSFYYSDGSSLFGYDMKKKKSRELLDWVSSNVNTNYIGETGALPDGRFVTHYYDYSGESGETEEPAGDTENALYIFTKVDPEEVKEKIEITYRALYVDDALREQVVKYNNSQERYRVVVEDYSASSDPVSAMHGDLMAGNVPDIMDMSGISSEKYIAEGMFTDLYTLMEKDSTVKKEDFIDNVMKIMETDGKLYRITPVFGLNAMVGKKTLADVGDSFTLEDLEKLEASHAKESEETGAKAFYMSSNATVLTRIFAADYYHYVNWEKGECSFDTGEFAKLLAYADTYPSDEDMDWFRESGDYAARLKNEDILFATVSGMSVEEIQLYKAMFGEDVTFVGYPSTEENGAAVSMNMELGISARSENKEAAWNFLKTFLTREYVSANPENYYYGFPIRKDCLEDIIKRYSATEKYTDDFGNEYLPYESKWGYDNMEVEITPLARGEVELLREVIAGAKHMYVYDEEIMTIITEEAEAYFAGECSGEEAAADIQARVVSYMEEIPGVTENMK